MSLSLERRIALSSGTPVDSTKEILSYADSAS